MEHSSYESHPLGRTEWVKLYGALLGKEDEAEALFEEQASQLKSLENTENTGKTVAFFYINSMVRRMCRKRGLCVQNDRSGWRVSTFLKILSGRGRPVDDEHGHGRLLCGAKDADYIIYNSTIDGELKSPDELLKKVRF